MLAIDEIIDNAPSLPPAPRILPELLSLLRREDIDAVRISSLITYDPVLTAQVLRRCNSAYYGFSSPVCDVQDAILRIGFGEVYRIVACVVGEQALGLAQTGYGIAQGEMWKHCAASAVAARIIARELNGDEAVAFTAGLLHDIGKLVLSTALEGAYTEVTAKTEGEKLSFLEAEKSILGVDHAEVGGRLLTRWSFPQNLISAVRHHHDPVQARPDEVLASYVHLGDLLAHWLGHGYGYQAYALRCRSEALDILEVTPRELEQFLIKTSGGVDEVLSLKPITA